VLVVLEREDEVAYRSFRNLPEVQLVLVDELNAYDVLCNDWLVFTRSTLPGQAGSADARGQAAAVTEPSLGEAPTASETPPEPAAAPEPVAEVEAPEPGPAGNAGAAVLAPEPVETESSAHAAPEHPVPGSDDPGSVTGPAVGDVT
jgi:hypothetical protein